MCNCMTLARTPEMTDHGGKYPPANHHPSCEDFRLDPFVRVEHDGSWCVMEPAELDAFVQGCETGYKVETVMLTRDQFENIPEFNGF